MVRRGEPGADAFWLESGTLDVVSDSGTVLGQIDEGSLVGEYAALVGGERTASIRASGPAAVRVLTPDGLDALLTAIQLSRCPSVTRPPAASSTLASARR